MIADISITEKSFGDKLLMSAVKFSVNDGEKIGIVGRNGVGKSTLFGILAGTDTDYAGEVVYRRGLVVASTAQEYHHVGDMTVMRYILQGLPEYAALKEIIDTYPETMGDTMRKIAAYTEALERFDQKGFYQVEERIERELAGFGLAGVADRPLSSLSGGQKRLIEIVKIMHSQAQLALIDEPTNHMDYVAKQQFIDWVASAREAMLIITHDRDVLERVDRIIELKDGGSVSYKGNYEAYLRQNAHATATGMSNFEQVEKRIVNLRQKALDYQRLKEKSRNPGTIQKFKRLETEARAELAELEAMGRPSFWIDKESVDALDWRAAERYDKFKAKNIRLSVRDAASRSKHVLVQATDLAVGIGERVLFEGVNIDLREGEAVELRGRNGAGKTTLIRALLASRAVMSDSQQVRPRHASAAADSLQAAGLAPLKQSSSGQESSTPAAGAPHIAAHPDITAPIIYDGELFLDPKVRVGMYEQEISEQYLALPLGEAIERMYLDRDLSISDTKIRQLCADYLFTDTDRATPLARLSGGQKARFQIISMLANDPQLLILDEPTNHLDLPSIEELETALNKYSGAMLYVSHDNYFRDAIGGDVVQIGLA